jgi:exodeoxyribonuclease VII small subunit
VPDLPPAFGSNAKLDAPPPLAYFERVPANPKNAGPAAAKEALPFEEALKKLESIVETMETGDLPLESLLERFEEGTRLVKVCQQKLEEAELKIQQLEKNAAGEPALKPWTPGAAAAE